MNHRQPIRSSADHLTDEQLLCALDGELSSRELAKVQEHIAACWTCRARRERMERTISHVIAWRNKELARCRTFSGEGRNRLARELAEQEEQVSLSRRFGSFITEQSAGLFSVLRRNRACYLSGAVSVAMILLLVLLPVVNPPVVTAAVFLEHARLSRMQETSFGQKVIHQRFEIRTGNRSVQHQIVLNESRVAESSPPGLPVGGPLDWNDPLGADSFQRWRDALREKQDHVRESGTSITLTTEPAAAESIVSASLTVRRSDWHPIAKRIEFHNQPPLEVRELAYEIREMTQPKMAAREIPSEGKAFAATEGVRRRIQPELAQAELDEAEVRLREVFHDTGADLNEVPEIIRGERNIRFRAYAQTTERKEELLAASQGISHVAPDISVPDAMNRPGEPLQTASSEPAEAPVYAAEPPLAKALWDYLGGLDIANNYLELVRDSYRQTFVDAAALDRLSKRYSGTEWNRLSPELQARVNRLAAEYIHSIRKHSEMYLKQLSSVLDEMLLRNQVTVSETISASASGCEAWQILAPSVANDLRRLQTAFRRLFVVDQTELPLALSAEDLLTESAQLRTRLLLKMEQLCSPKMNRVAR